MSAYLSVVEGTSARYNNVGSTVLLSSEGVNIVQGDSLNLGDFSRNGVLERSSLVGRRVKEIHYDLFVDYVPQSLASSKNFRASLLENVSRQRSVDELSEDGNCLGSVLLKAGDCVGSVFTSGVTSKLGTNLLGLGSLALTKVSLLGTCVHTLTAAF